MKKFLPHLLFLTACLCGRTASAQVTVFPDEPTGPVKMMNATNNCSNEGIFTKALEIPYVRAHDSMTQSYGTKIVDIRSVFPDFSKDAHAPQSYDFKHTDRYLQSIINSGSKVYYRLGQSAESGRNKTGPVPPEDFNKWAVICEHVVRHYNEGWANGFHMGIEYWEIWNEPNMDSEKYGLIKNPRNPSFWAGTDEEYYKLYTVASKHLRKCFPGLKIGGPAFAGSYDQRWIDGFLTAVKKEKAPLDFFSYHKYATHPGTLITLTREIRAKLDEHGFKGIEMILGEWNYVADWSSDGSEYSSRVRHGIKGAAFTAAVMSSLQNEDVQMLQYYDFKKTSIYNGIYDRSSGNPLPGYYAFLSWAKLRRLGTSLKVETGKLEDIFVTAARAEDGSVGILLTRYNNDDSIFKRENVEVSVPGRDLSKARCVMTNDALLFTEYPAPCKDGRMKLNLKTNCFAYIELPAEQ